VSFNLIITIKKQTNKILIDISTQTHVRLMPQWFFAKKEIIR